MGTLTKNNNSLQDAVKDLGVTLSSELNFKKHIATIIAKANRVSGLLQRTFTSRNRDLMRTLLKTMIVPQLEYSSVLWSPTTRKLINELESVQRVFTKKIENYNRFDPELGISRCFLSYEERLKDLKLHSLERRRERYSIMYLYKILTGYLPNCGFSYHETRNGWHFTPKINMDRTTPAWIRKARQDSFFVRGPQTFNWLPARLKKKPLTGAGTKKDIERYKIQLDKFLDGIPDIPERGQMNSLLFN